MKTKFIYEPEIEFERIIFIIYGLATSLYQNYGFLILPYSLPKNPKSVYLPRLKNFDCHLYIDEIRNNSLNIPLDKTRGMDKIITAIKNTEFVPEHVSSQHIQEIEMHWPLVQTQFEDYLFELLPVWRSFDINLEVYWSHYGTLMSYGLAQKSGKKLVLRLCLRDDMGIAQIAEGILSSILTIDQSISKKSWYQQETIVDFLLQNTKMTRLFPSYHPTISSHDKVERDHKEQIYKDSASYLKELGFWRHVGLHIKNDTVLIDDKLPKFTFTQTETRLLQKFISFPNEIVSYYEIGDILWDNNPDKFSLWALSRILYKLRNKLYKNNLSPEMLQNIRNRGYCFNPNP